MNLFMSFLVVVGMIAGVGLLAPVLIYCVGPFYLWWWRFWGVDPNG